MQKTDLNVSPYYDDFDPNDNFQRVLFRPGFAVQARELTTLQSILQNQIERNGRHFFKEGSMIIPGQISFTKQYYAVKLQSRFSNAAIADYLSSYVGAIVTGSLSGITARVVGYADATTTDSPTLFVKYLSTALNTVTSTDNNGASTANVTTIFVNGESLAVDKAITYTPTGETSTTTINANTQSSTILTSEGTAIGSSAAIEEGVYFVRGQFVKVLQQRIVLDKYSNSPSYRIGLTVSEELVTPEADTTLLDNATGSSNVNAKGAHRLKVSLTLSKLPLGSTDDENFIELMRIKNGSIEKIIDKTDYNIFQENLARRTFDESGNYSVRPFNIDIKDSLDDGSNEGVYSSTQTTDSGATPSEALASVQIDPGKAYVRGYEIETITPTFLDIPKPRTTDDFDSAISNIEVGNFTQVTNVFGSPDLSPFISGEVPLPHREIELNNVQKSSANSSSDPGGQIGVARARGFEHVSGNTALDDLSSNADRTAVFNIFLFDIRMFTTIQISANFSGASSVAQGSKITGNQSGATGFIHSAVNNLIELVTVSGNFVVGEELISSSQTTSNNASQFVINSSSAAVTVSAITKRSFEDVKSLFMDANSSAPNFVADLVLGNTLTLGGSVTMNGSNANVTGFNTTFQLDLKEGDIVTVPGAAAGGTDLTATVNTINNNTSIVLGSNSATPVTTVPIIRKRSKLNDQEKNLLLRKLRKKRIKTLKTDSNSNNAQTTVTFRRQFVTTTTSSGEIVLTAGANETFAASSNTDYIIQIITAGSAINGSSNTAAAGDLVSLTASTSPAQTLVPSGNQVTITNEEVLGGSAKVKVIATLTKTVAVEKTKTNQPCQLVLVDADSSSGPAYGTASQHKEISLGRGDYYKLYAVLDSEDASTNPSLPTSTITGLSGTFTKGETITGEISGCVAKIINTTNPITFIITNGKEFTFPEKITGATSSAFATLGTFTAGSKDITNRFTLDTGQRDNFYDISRIVRKAGKPTPVGKLLIVANYFSHGTGPFFTVDSYSGIDYKDIPTYTATRVDPEVREPSGEFDLRDTVDFRPRVADIAVDTSVSIGGTQTIKITAKSFDFSSRAFEGTGASTVLTPKDNSTFQYDFEFFLARKDLLYLTETGVFKIVSGVPAELPSQPRELEKAMLIASIDLPPYVLDIDDVTFKKARNRRYTMRDIGAIERRLNQIEYYTALNLLEKDAKSFQVQDENGLDRFKSGFVVDNFSGHSVGDVQNEDYRVAIDYEKKTLRPSFFMKGIELIEENTLDTQRTADGYQKTGDVITLPYTDIVSIQQPFASRVENLNPVLTFTWTGICTLAPSGDEWFEVERLPALIINVEGNFDQMVAQLGNAIGTIWNSWETTWSGTSVSSEVISQDSFFNGFNANITNTVTRVTTTTTQQQIRFGTQTEVVADIEYESIGDKLRSTAVIPFMRTKNVTFVAQGMKPHTRVYPFFDKVSVTSFVTPTGGSLGGNLVTDGNGQVGGVFLIPDPNTAGNPKFKTGERLFRLTSSATNLTNPEPETFAQAIFTSTGILRTVQEEIIATRNGRIEVTSVNQTQTVSNSTSSEETTSSIQFVQQEDNDSGGVSSDPPDITSFDPLAQTFESSQVGGEMITKIDVFFQRKDKDIPVLCQIREVQNGFPTIKQLPFAGKHLNPYMKGTVAMSNGGTTVTGTDTDFLTGSHNLKVGDTITLEGLGTQTSGVAPDVNNYDTEALVAKVTAITSDTVLTVDTPAARVGSGKKISNVNIDSTATAPTTFRFDAPIYIKDDTEYCIVLFTPCESYFAWISRMGELDIGGTRMISKQPHLGVLFKSQNNKTWNSYQYEDMKFTIYRAQFTSGSTGTLTLNNNVVPSKTLATDPVRTISGQSFVQITHPNHHMYSVNNNVTISGVSSGITTTLNAAITGTGTGASNDITIVANSEFVADTNGTNITIKIDNEIIVGTVQSSTVIRPTTRGADGTTAATHSNGATVELYQLNGIPLDQINKTHNGLANVLIDSYTVSTSVNANATSNQGGSAVVVTENAMMDGGKILLPVVQFPDTEISSSVRSTSATSPNGSEASFNLQGASFAKGITLGENFFFDKPRMIASSINETNEISGSKSFFLDVSLSTTNQNLSPIVDLDRKSVVAFTNRLNKIDAKADIGVAALQGDFVSSDNPSGDNNSAIYITRRSALETPATGLKVILDARRFASSEIKVMFKILRSDDSSDFDEIGYQYFNTTGTTDSVVNASLSNDDFKEHQYTAGRKSDGTGDPLEEFIAFSIKIIMQGTNTSEPPLIKDLRAIALAT